MKLAVCFVPCIMAGALYAQDKPPELTPAEKQFRDSMVNVSLVGWSTRGDSGETHEDRYAIDRVTKIKGNLWKFEARIQYKEKDFKIAMPLPIEWAGDTPVISLTNFAIPGSGKYTARVVIYNGAYAGVWDAGNHGGKVFGKIVKNEKSAAESAVPAARQ